MSEISTSSLADWKASEALAEAMIPLIGKLYREHNVVIEIYGHSLVNRSAIHILKEHRYVRQIEEQELSLNETYPVLEALSRLALGASVIDIGKLAKKIKSAKSVSIDDFVKQEVAAVIGTPSKRREKPQDVVLYGFGRIGRLLARILIEKTGSGEALRLRAIVVRKGSEDDLAKRASLLRRDSVHGPFQGTIVSNQKNNTLLVNGNVIQVIYASVPDTIDYTQYDINDAIVVDSTGAWRNETDLSAHLKAKGASRVLLTAPGKGDLKNIVYGINNNDILATDKIISAASCTTNAITPVLKVLNDKYGIEHGHVETVHSYTNDQNLIDNFHKGSRRGRSAALNMVITETGAAKAVAKALPELKGKLTGNAIRVPTPNVSLAILNLNLNTNVERDDINNYLRNMALYSPLSSQIDYVNSPEIVSSDFVGSRHAGVIDAQATIASGGKSCVLYVWYDNEFGYSAQVVRILQQMGGVSYATFPIAN